MPKTLLTGFGSKSNLYLVELTVPGGTGAKSLRFEYRRFNAPAPAEALKVVLREFPEAVRVQVFSSDAEYEQRTMGESGRKAYYEVKGK